MESAALVFTRAALNRTVHVFDLGSGNVDGPAEFLTRESLQCTRVTKETAPRAAPPTFPQGKNQKAAARAIPRVRGRCGVVWRTWPKVKGLPKAKVSLVELKGFVT